MNLTFVLDGDLALTTLEDSFLLFTFDGYLIYGEVPPPPSQDIDGFKARQQGRGRYIEGQEELRIKELIDRDNNDILDILSIFMKVNQN